MPRQFRMTVETYINGNLIYQSNNSHTCRDNAIGNIRKSWQNPLVWQAIVDTAPKERGDELRKMAPAPAPATDNWLTGEVPTRVFLATYLANQHRIEHRIGVRVSGVAPEAAVYCVGKLQDKFTTVEFSVEEHASGFGEQGPQAMVWMRGDAQTVPAWWWMTMLLRISAVDNEWSDVTTVLSKTSDVDNGIGPGGRASTLSAWKRLLARADVAGIVMLMQAIGPIQSESVEYSNRFAERCSVAYQNWRNFAFNLTPRDERPDTVEVKPRGKRAENIERKAKKAAAAALATAEAVVPTDQPITLPPLVSSVEA